MSSVPPIGAKSFSDPIPSNLAYGFYNLGNDILNKGADPSIVESYKSKLLADGLSDDQYAELSNNLMPFFQSGNTPGAYWELMGMGSKVQCSTNATPDMLQDLEKLKSDFAKIGPKYPVDPTIYNDIGMLQKDGMNPDLVTILNDQASYAGQDPSHNDFCSFINGIEFVLNNNIK